MLVKLNIYLIQEPGGIYLGHASIEGKKTGQNLFGKICESLQNDVIDLSQLHGIGSDDTGKHGGIIRLFELRLHRPLQWSIYLLHFNELPLRHLILKLDGPTSSTDPVTGPLSKLLSTCEKWLNFKQSECL